uniref:Ubiquitin carboxyl-terminal hydrolase 22 n=1 Tax=Cajanus cajan TaxID=3821 RepID=A0A151TLE6_CAJCA|nr:Ubiquitin carboxyl-terminal hydrolase 22 [Cajanus cajan]
MIFPFHELCSKLELFVVFKHTGKLDVGHYVTYLPLNNRSYTCYDAWVTQVHENEVAQYYMMFYAQRMLYYKAIDKQKQMI